jgi:hypothetical protein
MNKVNLNTNPASSVFASYKLEARCSLSKLLKITMVGLLMVPWAALGHRDICQQVNTRHFCEGNLGIRRENMPQIEGDALENYLALKERESSGSVVQARVPSHKLIFTQNEVNKKIVFDLIKDPVSPCEREILVVDHGNDQLYVADGHHRATACKLLNGLQLVRTVKGAINHVIQELLNFPGVVRHHFDKPKIVS